MVELAPNSSLPDWFEDVYETVRQVPSGKVATYGQIAGLVTTVAVTARQVGAAMRYAPASVPWQRVVGAAGRLPIAKRSPDLKLLQQRLLVEEGVPFLSNDPDQIDMARAQYAALPGRDRLDDGILEVEQSHER